MKKNVFIVWTSGIIALLTTMFTFHVSSSAQSFRESTRIYFFDPFSQKGGLKSDFVVITRTSGGDCTLPAEADKGRTNAFKCTVSTMTLDPCFADDKILVCLVSPWTKRVVQVEMTKPLPKKKVYVNTRHMPWAIELSNGARCSFVAGEDINIHDQRINYFCSKFLYVVGDIDQATPLWSAKMYNSKTDAMTQLAIFNAWY